MLKRLHLTNTLSGKKERFQPVSRHVVKMFTCGPSIYARPHIGNFRTFLYEDILQRYLEYLGYRIDRLLNFTDVEDKAIAKAREEGLTLRRLTGPNAAHFKRDARALKIRLPSRIPRASETVHQAVQLVKKLIRKGHAYWHEGDVFYDPLTFREFGKLYGLDMDRWPKQKKRFRKDTYPGQRWNLGDFILWFGDREEEEGFNWDTDIGRGRPAWNIQDAAMITQYLGYRIDIGCGGIDNLKRHHDYTIAVIEGISGREFAHYWLHGEHVLIDGTKMSKSKGNIVYLEDLLNKGHHAGQVRFFLITPHYRKKVNLTPANIAKAGGRLDAVKRMVAEIKKCRAGGKVPDERGPVEKLARGFEERMNDDLDVNGAVRNIERDLRSFIRLLRSGRAGAGSCRQMTRQIGRVDSVLQVLL